MPILALTPEQAEDAYKSMDGDLLYLLENIGVSKQIISVLGHLRVRRLATFACIESTDEGFRKMVRDDLGLDPADGMETRVNVAMLVESWNAARDRIKRAADADAEARAEGRPRELPKSANVSLRKTFENLHGERKDSLFPSAGYLSWRLEQLEEGDYRAESLSEVVSVEAAGDDAEDVGLTFSKTGTLRVRRGKTRVPMPSTPEELRRYYKVMAAHWEVVRLKHPDRHFLQELTRDDWERMLDYLLGEEVMEFKGAKGAHFEWEDLLAYELELRRWAIKKVTEGKLTLREGLHAAIGDNELRTKFFLTPLALTRAPRRRSRSRSPRKPKEPQNKGAKGSKGRGKKAGSSGDGKPGKGGGDAGSAGRTAMNRARKKEWLRFKLDGKDGQMLCIRYNQGYCGDAKCRYAHACMRCGQAHGLFNENGECMCKAEPTKK